MYRENSEGQRIQPVTAAIEVEYVIKSTAHQEPALCLLNGRHIAEGLLFLWNSALSKNVIKHPLGRFVTDLSTKNTPSVTGSYPVGPGGGPLSNPTSI